MYIISDPLSFSFCKDGLTSKALRGKNPWWFYLKISPYYLHMANLQLDRKLAFVLYDLEICTFVLDFVCFLSRFSLCPSGLRALVGTEKKHRISFIRSLWKLQNHFSKLQKLLQGLIKNVREDLLFHLSYSNQKHTDVLIA